MRSSADRESRRAQLGPCSGLHRAESRVLSRFLRAGSLGPPFLLYVSGAHSALRGSPVPPPVTPPSSKSAEARPALLPLGVTPTPSTLKGSRDHVGGQALWHPQVPPTLGGEGVTESRWSLGRIVGEMVSSLPHAVSLCFHGLFKHREKYSLEQDIREKEEAIRQKTNEVQVSMQAGFGRMDLVPGVVQGCPAGVVAQGRGAAWHSLETQALGIYK